MKKKLAIVTECTECPHYEHDNQEDPKWWGKYRCLKTDKEIPIRDVDEDTISIGNPIPSWCPLPNEFSKKEKYLLKEGLSIILDRYEGTSCYLPKELEKCRKLLERLKNE